MSMFMHERLYRSPTVMERLAAFPVTLCGAGALGSNLAENLARQGFRTLRVVDRDRIEERNLHTQAYVRAEVGARKAIMLGNALYRAVGATVDAHAQELTGANAPKLLRGAGLVIDTFDNSVSRQFVQDAARAADLPCLHVGMTADYAEAIWDETYRVPSDVNDDVCDYPLARNLVTFAVAVASEVVVRFAAKGERESYTLTLGDFAVRPYDLGA